MIEQIIKLHKELTPLGVDLFNFLFRITILILIIVIARNIARLLKYGEEDRKARQKVVSDLKIATDILAEKTEETIRANTCDLAHLHKKIDQNTEMTVKAAKASENAAIVANSMNEKIIETNKRILETQTGRLEEVGVTSHETLDTVNQIDKKVDNLTKRGVKDGIVPKSK